VNDVFMITYENWVKDRWRAICFTRYHLWIKGFEEKVKATLLFENL